MNVEEYAAQVVATAPKATPAQLNRLAVILRPHEAVTAA